MTNLDIDRIFERQPSRMYPRTVLNSSERVPHVLRVV